VNSGSGPVLEKVVKELLNRSYGFVGLLRLRQMTMVHDVVAVLYMLREGFPERLILLEAVTKE
jgi:hypothetical protein